MKSDTRWMIDGLGAAVAAALAEGYDGPPNGRVRDVPDRRTIRYYTTLGLLDPPVEMKGRTALYGRRHLLQLVAIKQLQARGRSLAEVQRALVGQPDSALERLAGRKVPEELSGGGAGRAPAGRSTSPRAAGFWRAVPEPAAAAAETAAQPAGRARPPSPTGPIDTLQGLRLAEGVTLLLTPARPLEADDVEALRTAAAPLLALLDRRRLIPRRNDNEKEVP